MFFKLVRSCSLSTLWATYSMAIDTIVTNYVDTNGHGGKRKQTNKPSKQT